MKLNFQFPFQDDWFEDNKRIKVSERNMFVDYHLFQVEAVSAVLGESSVYYFSNVEQARKNFISKCTNVADSQGMCWAWVRRNKSIRLRGQIIKTHPLNWYDFNKAKDYLIIDQPPEQGAMLTKMLLKVRNSEFKYRFLGCSENLLTQLSEFDLIPSRSGLLTSR